jgi:hypothetical protein
MMHEPILPETRSPRGSVHVVRVEPMPPHGWVAYLDGHQKLQTFTMKSLALVYARRLVANLPGVALSVADNGTS